MKNVFLIGCVLLFVCAQGEETYVPLDEPNAVNFSIRNFGIKVEGSLSGVAGEIHFDPEHPERALFAVTLDATTVNTGIDLRDNHLRKEDFFNVDKYKTIKFLSSQVSKGVGPNTWVVKGKLTMKGISNEVSIPFTEASVPGDKLKFSGEFKINRKDFEIGGRSISMGDDVIITLEVLARKNELLLRK